MVSRAAFDFAFLVPFSRESFLATGRETGELQQCSSLLDGLPRYPASHTGLSFLISRQIKPPACIWLPGWQEDVTKESPKRVDLFLAPSASAAAHCAPQRAVLNPC